MQADGSPSRSVRGNRATSRYTPRVTLKSHAVEGHDIRQLRARHNASHAGRSYASPQLIRRVNSNVSHGAIKLTRVHQRYRSQQRHRIGRFNPSPEAFEGQQVD